MLTYHMFLRKLVCALKCLWSDKNKMYIQCLSMSSVKMNNVGTFIVMNETFNEECRNLLVALIS